MNNNERLAKEIVLKIGGAKNITAINHCSTRLRLKVKDNKKFDIESIKKIEGVLDVVESMGGYQIIVGNNVSKVYREIIENYDVDTKASGEGRVKTNILDGLLNALSDIMQPVFPAIIAAGLFSAIATVCSLSGMSTESSTYQIIFSASQAPFYFLPFLVAYGSARHWKMDPVLTLTLAGILLYPDLLVLLGGGENVSLFGLPVTSASYASSLIPIILTCWAMSYVGGFIDKKCPDAVRYVFVPFLTMAIMIPIMLCITGPVGSWLGSLMEAMLVFLSKEAPFLGTLIVGCIVPFLVLTGSHLALIPLELQAFSTLGYEAIVMPAFIGMNFSQFAVSLAVFLKTKKKPLKVTAFSTGLTAFLSGTTEPTLYGICIRFKKPLIATFIGCIANAIFCAVFGVKEFSWGAPGFFTMVNFVDPNGSNNIYLAIGAAVVTVVVTFIATWVLGFDDSGIEDEIIEEVEETRIISNAIITSPVSGEIKSLESLDDPVFSNGMVGKGMVIVPENGEVYAPVDGEIIVLAPTKHAIGIKNDEGLEILVHVGLNSDQIDDEFTTNFKVGDRVKRGDLVLTFELDKLTKKGYRLDTPVIITNRNIDYDIVKIDEEHVEVGDKLFAIISSLSEEIDTKTNKERQVA